MKKIELTQGRFALVDDEDFEWLSQWKWQCHKGLGTPYAVRNIVVESKPVMIYMHREIIKGTQEFIVDHIDGDGLNNQKINLRLCSHSENMYNRKVNKNSKSGYKGVSWNIKRKKWEVQISTNKKHKHLGYYDNIEEAVTTYNNYAILLHGEFAKINKLET